MTDYTIIDRAVPGFRDAWLIFTGGKHYVVSAANRFGYKETLVYGANWAGDLDTKEPLTVVWVYDHEAAISATDFGVN